MKNLTVIIAYLVIALAPGVVFSQNSVTPGIHYQAVARDNSGKELYHKAIDVKFSIISETPLGEVVYQELHSHITTSKYGVFSLVIGKGTQTGGMYSTLPEVDWSMSDHFLKVEVKFENEFIDMGTMQFLAVPYALYAQKSLEPGPAGPQGNPGPKGDPGDPASDNQTLSFDETTLTVSGGNSVPLTSLLQNLTITNSTEGKYLGISRGNSVLLSTVEADGDPANELQDLNYDAVNRKLSLLKSAAPAIDLTELKNDADADPANEIQDLNLVANKLTITKNATPTEINLSPYLDNTDNQQLSYVQSTNTLSLTNGGSVSMGSMVAFRAEKFSSETMPNFMTEYDFIAGAEKYDDGGVYNNLNGIFKAPSDGIYSFVVNYTAIGTGDSRVLKLFLNNVEYEVLNNGIASNSTITRQTTLKLAVGDEIKLKIYVGTGYETGIGTFSGYKVY